MKKTHRGKNSKSKKNAKNTCNDTNKYAKKCYFDKATSKGYGSNNPANIRLDEDVFCLRLQKTSSRRLDQGEHIRDIHTSSEDVFKTSSRRLDQDQYIRLGHTSSRRFQDILPRCLQDVLQKRLQDVFINTQTIDFSEVWPRQILL